MNHRFAAVLLILAFIVIGCMNVENAEIRTVAESNDNNLIVGSLLTDQVIIEELKANYESSINATGSLNKAPDEVEFNFDSTLFFQIQEDVIAYYTSGKLEDKNFFLVSSMNNGQLYTSGLIFKEDVALETTGFGILYAYTSTGVLFGTITFNEDETFSSTVIIGDSTGYDETLIWWGEFTACLDDISAIVLAASLGGPAFGSGAAAGAVIGCGTVASIEWMLE